MTKALVCGGAWFVGSHLVERLLADGHTVDVIDDLSTGSLANLSDSRNLCGALKFHHLDVSAIEFGELVGLRQPEVIFHLALLPPQSSDTQDVLRSAPMLLSVLEAARMHGVGKVVVCIPAGLLYGEVAARYLPVKEGAQGRCHWGSARDGANIGRSAWRVQGNPRHRVHGVGDNKHLWFAATRTRRCCGGVCIGDYSR